MNQNEIRYKYYAFISYSHKDEKWAKWLHKKLESYKLPSVVCKEAPHLPKKISPVFLDSTDLGVGILQENLRGELEDSRYLIVICSPNSAKPNAEGKHWVDDEVWRFIELNRRDRIVPLIVSGRPYSVNPDEECLPPTVRENDILAADMQAIGRERALVMCVAKILGLKPDQLWMRHERREKARRATRLACAICSLLAACAGGYLAWDYYTPHTKYFTDYVEVFGEPHGIGKLSREEMTHRAISWQVITQKWKIRRVTHVNSAGVPVAQEGTEFADRPVDRVFNYLENGTVDSFVDYSETQRFLSRGRYDAVGMVSFHKENTPFFAPMRMRIAVMGAEDLERYRGSGDVTAMKIEYDESGRLKNRIFLNNRGMPVRNEDGVFGQSFRYTDEGQILEIAYLDNNGKPLPLRCGVASKHYRYDHSHWIGEL